MRCLRNLAVTRRHAAASSPVREAGRSAPLYFERRIQVYKTNPLDRQRARSLQGLAPRVDEATQTVLVKSALRNAPPGIRLQQFIRTRIVWKSVPGLTIPVTAVTRISGQYFCFVADKTEQGLVARQRPIEVGELVGNDYVVRGGLKAGDQVIVAGVQKIGEGAPIRAE